MSQGVSLCHECLDYIFKLIINLPTRLVKMLTFYWTIFTFIIKTDTFTNSLTDIHSSDDVITLLVHLGYLSFDLETKQAFIPNKEGHDRFKSAVRIA